MGLFALASGAQAVEPGRGLSGQSGSVQSGLVKPEFAGLVAPEGGDLIGRIRLHRASHDDTLLDLARAFDLGFVEMVAANPGVDPWLPGEGTWVVLPTVHLLPSGPHRGVVINLAEQRLYLFARDGAVSTFPIGVGKVGWETPLGETQVVGKRAGPAWYPTASARVEDPRLPAMVPPGPDNPLGSHALYLGWPAYLIHGTNQPDSIGRRVSHGCIRLYPEDISRLYADVPLETPVRVINEPVKLGWSDGDMYLEVQPPLRQADRVEATGRFEREPLPEVEALIHVSAGDAAGRLDWLAIGQALTARSGVPVRITYPARRGATIAAR